MGAVVTYRFKLKPTSAQHARLREALEHSRSLYNAALQERIECYRKTGKGRSYFDQTAALTQLRQSDPDVWAKFAWSMQSAPLKALDLAYKAFFKRGGFPRFKGRDWFKSIGWADRWGWSFEGGRFYGKGIGDIRVHAHRELPGKPKTARIKREGRHWYLLLTVERECAAANDNPAIGLDMGLSSLCALSDGTLIPNVRADRKGHAETRRRARALARCKRGSKRRQKVRAKLAAWRAKQRRVRDTHLHQVSASLAKRFGLIAIEALNVKGLARGILARDVADVAWGQFIHMLRYKAESAGAKLIEVDPRYTSSTCPECGSIKPKTLDERVHSCPCGCVMDRDVAAAKVILLRAVLGPDQLKVSGCAVPADGREAA